MKSKHKTYERGSFILCSDFEVRTIRDEDQWGDVDLFIPLGHRSINVALPFVDSTIMSRIQLSEIRSVVIRFNTSESNNWATIHFLNNVDLLSQVLNFEFQYSDYEIQIKQDEFATLFQMVEKGS
ncbi:hypothetical protein Amet_3689 [Alkaliphilus metalliredigens QYMF]|uniref:Uncharacterized protein n=1 Tax=Alkaliphilus metalliredigens (strain QYMF) TaxID=293826 RepID=A6TUE1_ALKMQ|nr:hypothetical protein [Alkaliphilus metalliredigens]ABR49809.1 hypothetical protein Amet_3689 [Alkaliphilus metalliredigens QYMF]